MIVVDINGNGDYTNLNDCLEDIKGNEEIFVKKGVYRQCVVVDKPNIHLIGEDKDKTIFVYNKAAYDSDEKGNQIGTFKTASFHILKEGEGFKAENLTFQNDAGQGYDVGQAVALYVDCDKAYFENCDFKAKQDTLLTAPMHEDIAKNPDILNRQYFKNCYIEGDVDFIFGGAVAYFDNCTIFALERNREINGYLTAACTSKNLKYGYVFNNCTLTGNAREGSVYLGRPWREYAKTVFINCTMDKCYKKEGFSVWNDTDRHKTCYYATYNMTGDGYNKESVAPWTYILEDISDYSIDKIFGDWKV